MNIQVPLLIAGITASTGIGVGTIAANTGAISISDLSLLTGDTSVASTAQTPVDVLVPVLDGVDVPAPTATSSGDESVVGDSADGTEYSGSTTSGTTATNSSSTSGAGTDGTSGGSASGEYDDDDDDDDEDDHDDDDDDEDDDDDDEDEDDD